MGWGVELNTQKEEPDGCTTEFNDERQRQMAN